MSDIFKEFRFKQGEEVNWHISPELSGTGTIVGAATTPLPVMGRQYMVKVKTGFTPNETYPFDTIAVSEIHIRPIDEGRV